MIRKLGNSIIGLVLMVWLTVVFLPSCAQAQGTLMQLPPVTDSLGRPIAGATINVFTATGNLPNLVCASPVTVYKDAGLTLPFTTLTTDGSGNYPFFIQPLTNPYGFTVSGVGTATSQCYGFTAPVGPNTSPTFLNVTVNGNLNVPNGNVSVGGTLCPTGNLDSHTIYAGCQSGADFGAKVNAAIALAVAGDTVDARGFNTNQTVSTIPAVSKSVRLLLPGVTLTCAMADPGTASGCFNVTADAVTIEGIKGQTIITQGNSALIQTAIYFGNHKSFTIRGIKLNWNEANNAKTTQFYTGIRSAGGSADIRIENNEFTATGDRSLDIRGANRIWIINNYFHQTGTNVGGTGGNGSAISVSVDGTTAPTDCWIENNLIEEWGDTALSCDHGARAHIIGNTVRGRADFSNAPSSIESALDIVGTTDVEVIGNHVLNVFLFGLDSESQTVGGVTYVPSNVRIIGNEFKHSLSSAVDPLVNFGTALATGQIRNVTIAANAFENERLAVGDIDGVSIIGNSFKDISTQVFTNAIQLQESTGVLADFHVEGNIFTTTNASMATAILVRNTVLTPGASTVGPNVVQSGITPIVNSGAVLQQNTQDNAQLYRRSADTTAAILDLFKARGTPASAAAVQSGDLFGQVNFWGFDGTNYIKSGMIQQNAQGAPAAGQVPSRMKFFAMNGSGSLVNLFILLGDAGQAEFLGDVFPDANGTRSMGIASLRWKFFGSATNSDTYQTSTNCSSSAGTCVAASAGAVSIAAAASTVTVATTAVTANSDITLTRNDALGTRLSVTCNTATAAGDIKVSTITPGTGFVITVQNAPAVNPLCLTYSIAN